MCAGLLRETRMAIVCEMIAIWLLKKLAVKKTKSESKRTLVVIVKLHVENYYLALTSKEVEHTGLHCLPQRVLKY